MAACSEDEARHVRLESDYVHRVYDQTAHHFEKSSYKAWPKVRRFIDHLEPGSLVADVGCGHGRYLHVNRRVVTLGSDRCRHLVDIAASGGAEVCVCDNLCLPYRDDCFDAVVSVGVVHHFSSRRRRCRAVSELARILRPGGKLVVCVWAKEQRRRKFNTQDVLVPWHLKTKPHTGGDVSETSPHHGDGYHDNRIESAINDAAKEAAMMNGHVTARSASVCEEGTSRLSEHDQPGATPPATPIQVARQLRHRLAAIFVKRKTRRAKSESGLSEKDLAYKKLVETIANDDMAALTRAVDTHHRLDGFAVREFPLSSRQEGVGEARRGAHSHEAATTSPSWQKHSSDGDEFTRKNGIKTLDGCLDGIWITKNTGINLIQSKNNVMKIHDHQSCGVRVNSETEVGGDPEGTGSHHDRPGQRVTSEVRGRPRAPPRLGGEVRRADQSDEAFADIDDDWSVAPANAIASMQRRQDGVWGTGSGGSGGSAHPSPPAVRLSIRRSPKAARSPLPSVSSDSSALSMSFDSDDDTASRITDDDDVSIDNDLSYNSEDTCVTVNGASQGCQATAASVHVTVDDASNCDDASLLDMDASRRGVSSCDNSSPNDDMSTADGNKFQRFYHVFAEGELVSLINDLDTLEVIKSYYDHANWCVIAEKVCVWRI